MTNPKDKASELFFHYWFNNYNLLNQKTYNETLDYIDRMIVQDKEQSKYWHDVKKSLASFKV